jgi:hypothetical protein
MKNTLRQKAFPFFTIFYELTDRGLSVQTRSLFKKDSYFLKFEEIGIKRMQSRRVNGRILLGSALMVCIAILMFVMEKAGAEAEKGDYLFYFGMAIIGMVFTCLSYKRSFFLAQRNNSNALEFLVNKPSEEEVEVFIHNLIHTRRSYLLEKFGGFNRLLSYEQQYHNLMWLTDTDVITNEEYLEKLEELNHLFSITRELSGFPIHLN